MKAITKITVALDDGTTEIFEGTGQVAEVKTPIRGGDLTAPSITYVQAWLVLPEPEED